MKHLKAVLYLTVLLIAIAVIISPAKAEDIRLEGTVTLKGAPATGMTLVLQDERYSSMNSWVVRPPAPPTAEIDNAGHYSLPVTKPGQYIVFALRNGEAYQFHQEIVLKTGVNKLDIVLPACEITGRVIYPKTGMPAANIVVCAYQWLREQDLKPFPDFWSCGYTDARWWYKRTAKTDSAGRFKMDELGAGKWIVAAIMGNCEPKKYIPSSVFALKENESKNGIDIRVPIRGSAQLAVLDAGTGKPIKDMFVTLTADNGLLANPDKSPLSGNG